MSLSEHAIASQCVYWRGNLPGLGIAALALPPRNGVLFCNRMVAVEQAKC